MHSEQKKRTSFTVDDTLCIGCGICERVCPVEEDRAVVTIYRGERRGKKAVEEYRESRKKWDAERTDLENIAGEEGWISPY